MSLNNPIWKFKDFIDIDKLSFPILSRNRYSIDYLYENEEDIDWYELSSNKYAMDIIENNLDKIENKFFLYLYRFYIDILVQLVKSFNKDWFIVFF